MGEAGDKVNAALCHRTQMTPDPVRDLFARYLLLGNRHGCVVEIVGCAVEVIAVACQKFQRSRRARSLIPVFKSLGARETIEVSRSHRGNI